MTEPIRPTSGRSNSMSTATTHQTIPLITVRRKLLRQMNNTQKTTAQRRNRSKHDMEELFKLYYSNDLQFDAFQRQIVTGKLLHTPRVSPRTSNTLTENSENHFDSKVCVSREHISPAEMDYHEQRSSKVESSKFPPHQRPKHNITYHHAGTIVPIPTTDFTLSARKTVVTAPPEPETLPLPSSSSQQHDELCDSSLVKSVTFLGDVLTESYENMNTTSKAYLMKRPTSSKSSLYSVPPDGPHPSILMSTRSPDKYSRVSSSTANSVRSPHRPNTVTGSAVTARPRPLSKPPSVNQRPKSNTTMATTVTSTSNKLSIPTRSSTIASPLSFQSDASQLPVFIGTERMVSIPSRCSRYVLVSFPEVPLRYHAPSYVERLLLPERFPTLFQNIVRSYSSRASRARSTK